MYPEELDLVNRRLKGAAGGSSNSLSDGHSVFADADTSCMTVAAAILKLSRTNTRFLKLENNPAFGYQGLKALVQGMATKKDSLWELEVVKFTECGLGGTRKCSSSVTSRPPSYIFGADRSLMRSTLKHPEATLNLLTQLVQLTPTLERINIDGNDFHDISASFVQAILSHPKCEFITLSYNKNLKCSSHRPNTCPINRLLAQLCIAASSSTLPLRGLSLEGLGYTINCCGPALEKLFSIRARGVQALNLRWNPALRSFSKPLIRAVAKKQLAHHEPHAGRTSRLRGLGRWRKGVARQRSGYFPVGGRPKPRFTASCREGGNRDLHTRTGYLPRVFFFAL